HQIATSDTERSVALDRAARSNRLAMTDALTGLLNRYALDRDLPQLPPEGSLTFIDLDGLKRYNDEHGHARGDELLTGFSKHLTVTLAGRAALYRVSGDEFAVTCATGDLQHVAEAIARAVGALQQQGFELAGASHGSVRRHETESLEHLKRAADRRMYQEKASRKSPGIQPIVPPPSTREPPRRTPG
ncbi:MAG: GGDEF domain-containing protein, partial [Polyangiaceae bacterium]